MSTEFMPATPNYYNGGDTLVGSPEPQPQLEAEAATPSNTELADYLAWEREHEAWLKTQAELRPIAQELNITPDEAHRLGIDFNNLYHYDILGVQLDRGRREAAARLNLPPDTSWDTISYKRYNM